MANDYGKLDEMIRALAALPGALKRAGSRVAKIVRKKLRDDARAGLAPDGSAWAPTVEGGRPLKRAHRAIKVTAGGNRVKTVLKGHHVYHHAGRGVPRRQVIPNKLEPALAEAIKDELAAVFRETMEKRK